MNYIIPPCITNELNAQLLVQSKNRSYRAIFFACSEKRTENHRDEDFTKTEYWVKKIVKVKLIKYALIRETCT